MSGYMSGYNKVDIAVVGASSDYTSPYYDMGSYEKAIFICSAGSMNSSENIAYTVYQAVSSTGSGAQVLGNYTTMGSTTALACNVDKAVAVILSGVSTNCSSGWTIAINGITFTGMSTASTAAFDATRTFVSSSNGGVSTQSQDHLAAYINHATYGCTGLLAVSAAASVTITANPPGNQVITTVLSASSGALVWPTRSVATLEFHAAEFASASSMRYVAVASVASVAGAITKQSAVVIRCGARYSPDSTALVSGYAQGA